MGKDNCSGAKRDFRQHLSDGDQLIDACRHWPALAVSSTPFPRTHQLLVGVPAITRLPDALVRACCEERCNGQQATASENTSSCILSGCRRMFASHSLVIRRRICSRTVDIRRRHFCGSCSRADLRPIEGHGEKHRPNPPIRLADHRWADERWRRGVLRGHRVEGRT